MEASMEAKPITAGIDLPDCIMLLSAASAARPRWIDNYIDYFGDAAQRDPETPSAA
jgi:hypothetical protein